MEMTTEELQNILKSHAEWLTWKAWDAEDEDTRSEELPQGERANLKGANLEGADLRYANLEGADLRYANLEGADLRYANLEGANLRGANLRCADLESANLKGADLESANLKGADLRYANLRCADLRYANLKGANLKGADLRYANLEGADLPNGIPVIQDIDTKIHEAVETCGLQMSDWHCGTTHCRAGWAIHLAGEEGYALEEKLGSEVAGTLIYMASRPDKKHPDFFCSDDEALDSIEEDAKGGVK
jgi:hypothetical protein